MTSATSLSITTIWLLCPARRGEVMCSKYYFRVVGEAADRAEAIAASKARIDVWVARVQKQKREPEHK